MRRGLGYDPGLVVVLDAVRVGEDVVVVLMCVLGLRDGDLEGGHGAPLHKHPRAVGTVHLGRCRDLLVLAAVAGQDGGDDVDPDLVRVVVFEVCVGVEEHDREMDGRLCVHGDSGVVEVRFGDDDAGVALVRIGRSHGHEGRS